MIWRIHDLVQSRRNPNSDFILNMPTLALSTTLELWICIIIACIPTLAPILKNYITPLVSKLSGSGGSAGARFTPSSLVTFGRLGSPRRKMYTTVYGSQDPISNDTRPQRNDPGNPKVREDASTTAKISSGPHVGGTELRVLPSQGVIHVQHEVITC